MTASIAESIAIVVHPDEHVAAWPAQDGPGGVAENPLGRSIPEDDVAVGADHERAVAGALERGSKRLDAHGEPAPRIVRDLRIG